MKEEKGKIKRVNRVRGNRGGKKKDNTHYKIMCVYWKELICYLKAGVKYMFERSLVDI